MKVTRNIAITIVCIILGIIIAWQFKSINYNKTMTSSQNKRIEDVTQELLKQRKIIDDLSKRNSDLEQANREYENARGDNNKITEAVKKELQRARVIAGLTEVRGKGIKVTIDNNEPSYVEDSNILDVLNELKASDAQAISVNGERIFAMSEVRVAGKYIMVNGKQLLAPFVIKAIADPEKLEHSLKIIGGVVEKLELYQLKVSIEKSDNITIPGVRDDGSVIKIDMLNPVK